MDFELDTYSVPIPTCFHSIELGGPFKSCTICKCDLLNSDKDYYIEKVFRDANVEFEYAICENCKSELSGKVSMKSMMNIGNYFMKNFDMESRIAMINNFDNSIIPWIERCIFKGIARSNCRDYQLSSQCHNDQLIVSILPFMVSFEATKEIQETISKETKENFDKFVKEVLNPPSTLKDLPVIV